MSGLSSYFEDNNAYSMIFREGYYWLASRYSGCHTNIATFGLQSVGGSSLAGGTMFVSSKSYNAAYNVTSCLQPVVSLASTVVYASLGKDSNGAWQIKNQQ